MSNFIKSIFFIFLFSSCYTAKQAQRDIIKADVNHPIVTSGFCAEKFPVKEKIKETTKFIKGETIIKKDTITIDCDQVVSDKTQSNKVKIKYKTIYQTDTIVKEKVIEKENMAKTTNLNLQIQKLKEIKESNEKTISDLKQSKSSLWKYLFTSLILNFILIALIVKK